MREQFEHTLLSRILCAREPLPFTALAKFSPDDMAGQRRTIRFLGSLLSGTHNENTPIVPLHASYREFLYDPKRSGAFFVDEKKAHELMGLDCLRVMETELVFNICRVLTSFLPNLEIPNIDGLIRDHISLPLSYASRNWTFHVAEIPDITAASASLLSFFRDRLLKWLEVMSLTQSDPYEMLTALANIKVRRRL